MNIRALEIMAGNQRNKGPSINCLAMLVLLALCVDMASAQTVLINGANQTGTIYSNTIADSYTFTANAGDSINLRLGTTGFVGNLELDGPGGAELEAITDATSDDVWFGYTATNSGTFTVLVSSKVTHATGTYVLNLSQIPEPFIVPAGYGGGPLANGANAAGTITLGRQDLWTFTANAGDNINLRLGTTGFDGNLELYGPNGAVLQEITQGDSTDVGFRYTATNSGTFTVLVSSQDLGGNATGTYVLNLSQIPEPFIVPAGYGGGPLTNGANAAGTITLGRQDLWNFTANAGDNINLRLGTTGFDGNLELYGPNGAELQQITQGDSSDIGFAYMATNSGTFTVLVSSQDLGGYSTGTYVLNLSQIPEPFIVPDGYGGGPITNGSNLTGNITLGRQDMWAFTACAGDTINLGLKTTNFLGNLGLYGPNGALLQYYQESANSKIAYTATNCGTFTVLVDSYDLNGNRTGTYGLTANGLAYELRECLPKISGTNFTFNAVGGNTNANAGFVMYSTTNIATPFGRWTPVLTNQFDQFGVFDYTNIYSPARSQEFYRFITTL